MPVTFRAALQGALILAVILAGGFLLFRTVGAPTADDPARLVVKEVAARAETAPVDGEGDAADDAAIWVAQDPGRSLVLGTDKEAGLLVHGLDGRRRAALPLPGRINNIDLRAGFRLAGRDYVLVAATALDEKSVALFLLDPETGGILRPFGGNINLDVDFAYGLCLYRSPDGTHYVFATGGDARVRQFKITADAGGGVTAERVRAFRLGSEAEGCVADDRTRRLYIAEEDVGIRRFGAEPGSGKRGRLIAKVGGGALTADVEGLAIYPERSEKGWLVASSQGDSTFAVFRLPDEELAGRFRIGAGRNGTVDEVTHTDGIEITPLALPGYPEGLLVVQDDEDDSGRQNYKLVDWRDIRNALELE